MKLEKTDNGYAVQGRDTFIFKNGKQWVVSFRTWSGARERKEFARLSDAKSFAINGE